jgi:hypothetical protein
MVRDLEGTLQKPKLMQTSTLTLPEFHVPHPMPINPLKFVKARRGIGLGIATGLDVGDTLSGEERSSEVIDAI